MLAVETYGTALHDAAAAVGSTATAAAATCAGQARTQASRTSVASLPHAIAHPSLSAATRVAAAPEAKRVGGSALFDARVTSSPIPTTAI